ncbi:MAG: shikimate kinase [Ignavibacteriae bacterium]|nr:MAG: shikimate kinase [Ignavibacteriota bacterium]
MKESFHGHKKSLIFLTGFMGSGKSTIGPILANALGYEYLDVDQRIEHKTNKLIAEIFKSEGEQAFRTLERDILLELAELNHCVISLGGGTIANEENCQLVLQKGILVYLKLSPDEIIQRVQYRNDRPLLRDANGKLLPLPELKNRVLDLMNRREHFYARADVVITADNMRVGATVDEIMKNIHFMIE